MSAIANQKTQREAEWRCTALIDAGVLLFKACGRVADRIGCGCSYGASGACDECSAAKENAKNAMLLWKMTEASNAGTHRPERAGGDVEMQNRAESARSGSVQRPC
jgi:hypothetical protein